MGQSGQSITIKPVATIRGDGDDALSLPNSVAVFADGRIAVADSGHNRVCIFDPDGHMVWQSGGWGFGLSKFREPIYVGVDPHQNLFVSDLHNHRWVIYNANLKPVRSFGYPGHIDGNGKPSGLIGRMRSLLSSWIDGGEYVGYFFTPGMPNHIKDFKRRYSVVTFLRGFGYHLLHPHRLMAALFCGDHHMLKPNGIAFWHDKMVITQKGNKLISVYTVSEPDYRTIKLDRHITIFGRGERFERLGNLCVGPDGRFYVCDQRHNRIVVFNADMTFDRVITVERSPEKAAGPFSCVVLGDKYLAVALGYAIEIWHLNPDRVVMTRGGFGETHGITWDAKNHYLYYVDRSNHAIQKFAVDLNAGEDS